MNKLVVFINENRVGYMARKRLDDARFSIIKTLVRNKLIEPANISIEKKYDGEARLELYAVDRPYLLKDKIGAILITYKLTITTCEDLKGAYNLKLEAINTNSEKDKAVRSDIVNNISAMKAKCLPKNMVIDNLEKDATDIIDYVFGVMMAPPRITVPDNIYIPDIPIENGNYIDLIIDKMSHTPYIEHRVTGDVHHNDIFYSYKDDTIRNHMLIEVYASIAVLVQSKTNGDILELKATNSIPIGLFLHIIDKTLARMKEAEENTIVSFIKYFKEYYVREKFIYIDSE